MKYLKLTPKEDANIDGYKDAIMYALKENDIENIALTGGYGTGKSSIIKTFFKKYNNQSNLMYINLGSYEHDLYDTENELEERLYTKKDTSTNIKLYNIEEKIISQVMQQINKKHIPYSLFNIKENDSKISRIIFFIQILILTLVSSYFILPIKYNPIILKFGQINRNIHIVLILTFLLSISYILFNIYIKHRISNLFKKISLYGSGVEFSNKKDYSYFDKYMNDIIYIFLSSKKKIFIFEDLDRFNEPLIYEKLVEINTLLNKRISKGTVKFIYLLRDDIFKSKERTKIFDFIIPVVPIIAHGNSFNKFDEIINDVKDDLDNNINLEFDKKFIQKILLYIDDMRLLKNIINEYFLYYKIINSEQLDSTKLLGILIYKNIFPKDFYFFQYGKSYIDIVFSKRDELIENEQKENTIKIEQLDKKIKEKKKSALHKQEEIESLYFPFVSYPNLKIKDKEIDIYANKVEIIKLIKNNDYEIEYSEFGYRSRTKINVKEEFEKIKQFITSYKYPYLFESYDKLDDDLRNLEYQNEIINNLGMRELLVHQNRTFFTKLCDNTPEFNYLLEHEYLDLIIMLLREGLIDRQSLDYISEQKDKDLDSNDTSFLRKVYDYHKDVEKIKLSKPEHILNKFETGEMKQRKLLNIDLTKYLIEEQHDWLDDVLYICEVDHNLSHIANVIESYRSELHSDKNKLNNFKENVNYLFEKILSDEKITHFLDNQISALSKKTFLFVIESLKNNLLIHLISLPGIKIYLEYMKIELEELYNLKNKLDNLEDKKYLFKNIILPSNNKENIEMYEKLIDKNLIDITKFNILSVIEMLSITDNEKEKMTSNLSIMNQIQIESIRKYFIETNLNIYLSVYLNFKNKSSFFKDSIQDVLRLLKNKSIESDLLLDYLDSYNPLTGFTLSEEIPNKYLDRIIEQNIFEMTAENINFIIDNSDWEIRDLAENIVQKLEEINLEKIEERIIKELLNNILDFDNILVGKMLRLLLSSYPNLLIHLNIDKLKNVSIELINEIIRNDIVSTSFRKDLFLANIKKLHLEQSLEYIMKLEFTPQWVKVLNRGRQTFEITKENRTILDYFYELGILANYNEDVNDEVYHVNGKDLKKIDMYKHINLQTYLN